MPLHLSESPQQILSRALILQRSGRLEDAEQLCKQALELNNTYADALYMLGVLHAQQKNYPQAESCFQQAIQQNPQRAEFYGNYANALLEQHKLSLAVQNARRSIELDNRQSHSHNILGNAYFLLGEFALATQSLREATRLNPAFALAHNKLGLALLKLQHFNEAAQSFEIALSLQADKPEFLQNLAQCYSESGQADKAYAAYQRLQTLKPDDHLIELKLREHAPFWNLPLQGKHLRLRRYQPEDCHFLLSCFAVTEFMERYHRFLPREPIAEAYEATLRRNVARHPCQLKAMDWIIETLGNDGQPKAIGLVNLVDIQMPHRRAELLTGIPDLQLRHRHYALEACLLALDFAFNQAGLNKLISYVYAANIFAQKNTLELGFRQEGYLQEHIQLLDLERSLDLYLNGLTEAAFRKNKRLAKLSLRLVGRDITQKKSPS